MVSPLPASPKPCLLVVEDEKALLAYLSALLNRDYHVFTAENSSEAEELLAARPVAVILCDHRLPGEQGLDFLRRMRRAYPRTQAILLTGDAEAETFTFAVEEKIVLQILMKPSSLTEIRAAVEQALEVHAKCPQKPLAERLEPGSSRKVDTESRATGRSIRDEADSAPIVDDRTPAVRVARAAFFCLLGALVIWILYLFKNELMGAFLNTAHLGDLLPF